MRFTGLFLIFYFKINKKVLVPILKAHSLLLNFTIFFKKFHHSLFYFLFFIFPYVIFSIMALLDIFLESEMVTLKRKWTRLSIIHKMILMVFVPPPIKNKNSGVEVQHKFDTCSWQPWTWATRFIQLLHISTSETKITTLYYFCFIIFFIERGSRNQHLMCLSSSLLQTIL